MNWSEQWRVVIPRTVSGLIDNISSIRSQTKCKNPESSLETRKMRRSRQLTKEKKQIIEYRKKLKIIEYRKIQVITNILETINVK